MMTQPVNPVTDPVIVGIPVMIEGSDAVSAGTLAYVEGDILEVQISNSKAYTLGEPVKLVMYSPDGILNMQSSIVARDVDSVFVLTPAKIIQTYLKRRKQPRVDVREKVKILRVDGSAPGEPGEMQPNAVIGNIGLGGMGFSATIPLKENQIITFEWNLEGMFTCRARIIHAHLIPNGYFYGSEFVDFPNAKLNLLRAYILRKQIENRQEQKRMSLDSKMTGTI
jgi:c-di-GMP-binding flagellar brake protein YcgR